MSFDKVILGNDPNCIFTTDSNATGLNNNILVVGSSGCGKTVSVAEARLLETFNSSLIVTVTKRRLVDKYKNIMIKRGYEVQDLDFTNPINSNIGYDPLVYVKSYHDITYLAKSIVLADAERGGNTNEPYWDQAAVSLLSAEIAYTISTKKNATFADVLNLHDKLEFEEHREMLKTSLDRKFELLELKEPSSFAVSCFKSFKKTPIRTAGCIFSTLNTTIDKIFNPDLRKTFSKKKKVDLEKLASTKTVLFITTSPVNSALNSFVNMFYGHAFKQLFEFGEKQENGMLPIPVHILADDFATGCQVQMFDEYISIFREKGIAITILIQSESQLKSLYGKDKATTIINNCDTYLFMGSMDLKTAKNIAKRSGKKLEEVLYMPLGSAILFRRGQYPIFTQRYDIFNDERYKEVTFADKIMPRLDKELRMETLFD